MIYHILIVANDIYFKLLEICVKSILHACNMDKIKTIFIADLGLNQANKKILHDLDNKIKIVDTNVIIPDSSEIHSQGWVDAVSQKTRVLANLIEENNTPIVMMDSDMIVIKNFTVYIDQQYDIQMCRRSKPLIRPDGLIVNYIASFLVVNNKNGLFFINAWINRIAERITLNMFPPHETPAMVEVLERKNNCTIGFIDDKIVSCENNYIRNKTSIIHAKGRTKKDSISIFRFANIKHFPYRETICLFKSNEKIIFTIVYVVKKIFNLYVLKENFDALKKNIKHIIHKK